jgi:hypothetical protein
MLRRVDKARKLQLVPVLECLDLFVWWSPAVESLDLYQNIIETLQHEERLAPGQRLAFGPIRLDRPGKLASCAEHEHRLTSLAP